MSEPGTVEDGAAAATAPSAGAMLRAAREKRGMHIAALAAAIKVPQRKLEALEADRYDELPDLTFTRALAQSVCRTLKVDMQPVLDRLPQSVIASPRLEYVGTGLNAPFHERPGRAEPTDWSWLRKPVVWGTLLVLLAAAALALLPERWLGGLLGGRDAAPTVVTTPAPAVGGALPAPTPAAEPASAASAVEAVASAAAPAADPVVAPTGAVATALPARLTVSAKAESWVEVQDASGQMLLSRSLAAGESVAVEGAMPLRATIGNATATQVTFRGSPVDLARHTRDNVARLQLN
jgi:cytoskeleton protein RodZ